VVLILIVGTVLSLLSFFFVNQLEEEGEMASLSFAAEQRTEVIKDQLVGTFEAVESIAAFYAASEHVSRSEFSMFSNMELMERPDVQALEWIPRVKDSERETFERRARNDGMTGFSFTQRNTQGELIVAGKRDEYFPVYYVEPLKANEAALGFDLASNPTRLKALNKARDTGRLQASGRITLVQESGNSYGILVFQPIYDGGGVPESVAGKREKLTGFALGVLRISDILSSGSSTVHTDEIGAVFVFDTSAPSGQQLLFPTDSPYQSMSEIKRELCVEVPLQIAGRSWRSLHCAPKAYSSYFAYHSVSVVVLIVALLLTIGLAAYLRMLGKRRAETKRFLNRIQSSESHLREIMDNVEDSIITSDEDGMIQEVNRSAAVMFGYLPEELVGKPIHILMPVRKQEGHKRNFQRFSETDKAKVARLHRIDEMAQRKDGTEFPVEVSVNQLVLDGKRIFIALMRDISIRKELEQVQAVAKQRMDRFFKVTMEGLFFHKDGIIIDVNTSGARLAGLTPEDVIGSSLFDYVAPEYHAIAMQQMQSASSDIWEAEIFGEGGERIPVEIQGRDIIINNEPVRVIAVRDISGRKQAEMESAKVASELKQLIDTANAPIFSIDTDGLVNKWNQMSERITGYSKADVMGRNLVENFITDNYKVSVKELLDKTLAGEETASFEFQMAIRTGGRVDVLLNFTAHRDLNGVVTGVIGIGQDITELNVSKAQIIQASKLATLGEMSTSVAHELNQPLNVMRMAMGNCRRKMESGNTDFDYYIAKMSRVEDQITRAAGIVDHMRMFGREALESFAPLDLREAVTSTLDMIGEQLRLSEIEIVENYCEKALPVMGHKIQIEQVLLNIIGNARDALNSPPFPSQKKILLKVECKRDHGRIIIEDNGGGIPEATLQRVFEPFFTTKKMGAGTGLGLSVSYGIIKEMGGSIIAENCKGGARFIISLPTVGGGEEQ